MLSQKQPELTYANLIDESVKRFPEKRAIVYKGKSITYAQLDERINRIANFLIHEKGLLPQEHVAIVSVNSPEYLEVAFACARANLVAVNINWRLAPREIFNLLTYNDVKLAFVQIPKPEWNQELLQLSKGTLDVIDMTQRESRPSVFETLLEGQSTRRPEIAIQPDDIVFHFHTSGTTGSPKCIMHSHRGLIHILTQLRQIMDFQAEDVCQCTSQMFHIALNGMCTSLLAGSTLIVMDHFDVDEFLSIAGKEGTTRIMTAPPVVSWLVQRMKEIHFELPTVKHIWYSSCPMPNRVIDEASALWSCSFYNAYGLTELGGAVSVLDNPGHREDDGKYRMSIGKPIPGIRVKVLREDGTECATDEIGEIVVQSPAMLKGYYKRTDLLEQNISDGWFHTKDLGCFNAAGYLFCHGRKDDMFISGGENVYPKEIEDCVMELFPEVLEAAAFGVTSERWGEVPNLCVVLKKGTSLSEKELISGVEACLAHYKTPKRVYFVDSLPKNATGKVMKKRLQKIYDNP